MLKLIKSTAKQLLPRRLCVSRLKSDAGDKILLTFDDGPHPETTPAVLDRLQQYDAKAIFFVVGHRIPRAPDLLNRILEEGHWLGNHTYAHPNDRQMPYPEYLADLRRCQEIIFEQTGESPRFHRPPCGHISMASLFAPKKCGLVTLAWSCSAEDWRFRSDADAISRANEMIAEVEAQDIVLFHDESTHTIVALDHLLPALKSRGLNFSPTLEDLL